MKFAKKANPDIYTDTQPNLILKNKIKNFN